MSLKKSLVTGAGGFIGSHLTERLVREGLQVTAFLHYNSRQDLGNLAQSPVRKDIRIIWGDLKDPHSVLEASRGQDLIFHLGAQIGIPYSYLNPADVAATNVMGTLHVLMAAREAGVQRVLHTSTSEVYGTAQSPKISENHPLQGQSPYSASKIGADKIVESFVHSYKLPVVTLRPFNTYGPRQSMRAVIPTIIGQALFQKEIVLGSLETVRDFTYVEDTVEAFWKGAFAEGIEGKVFNLGTDSEISVREISAMILRLTGQDKPVRTAAERKRPKGSEVMRLRSDFSLIYEAVGWKAKVTLEEGLRRTIAWIEAHPEDYSSSHYVV